MCAIPALTRSLVCARRRTKWWCLQTTDRPTQRTNERWQNLIHHLSSTILRVCAAAAPHRRCRPPLHIIKTVPSVSSSLTTTTTECLLAFASASSNDVLLLLMPLTSSRFLPSYHIIITILCPTLTNERPFIYTRLCRTGSISAPVPPPPSVSPLLYTTSRRSVLRCAEEQHKVYRPSTSLAS